MTHGRERSTAESSNAWRAVFYTLLAIFSGFLLGFSYPPLDISWLVWFALVPLLWVVSQEPGRPTLILVGFSTGLTFYLLSTYSLTSGHEWTGWMTDSQPGEREEVISRQQIILYLFWVTLSCWGAVFWGLFTLALGQMAGKSLYRIALLAPPLGIILTEWLRSTTSWSYQWAFLGNAAIPFEPILQLGALGGVWLISWIIILVNCALLALLSLPKHFVDWMLPGAVSVVLLAIIATGAWRSETLETSLLERDGAVRAAAIQFYQAGTTLDDYNMSIGLENAYLEMMTQVAQGAVGRIDLIVLPESVAIGALSLDGTSIPDAPGQVQWSKATWTEAIEWILAHSDHPLAIVIGLDTVERSKLHNSLVYWHEHGIEMVYHKQYLVPFAEYQPSFMKPLSIAGRLQYEAGQSSRVGQLHGTKIGSFICQEVLIASTVRQSVRNGAQLLVSGGNDGVFTDSTVAEIHAQLAQLRAVETGRYLVRAMRTGVSAIISPTGRELSKSQTSKPYVAVSEIHPLNSVTPYMRLGDWPILFALFILFLQVSLSRWLSR